MINPNNQRTKDRTQELNIVKFLSVFLSSKCFFYVQTIPCEALRFLMNSSRLRRAKRDTDTVDQRVYFHALVRYWLGSRVATDDLPFKTFTQVCGWSPNHFTQVCNFFELNQYMY